MTHTAISRSSRILEYCFQQPGAPEALPFFRASLAAVSLVLLILGPYDSFYMEAADLLYTGWQARWMATLFTPLHAVAILSALVLLSGYRTTIALPLFTFSFSSLQCLLAQATTIWNYNSHLNLMAAALCLPYACHRHSLQFRQRASFVMTFSQWLCGILYFQAGLSKLLASGTSWFLTGDTIRITAIRQQTWAGSHFPPEVFPFLGVVAGIFEFGFVFLLPFRRAYPWIAVSGILFHLGIFALTHISFWFLWSLYPALFIAPRWWANGTNFRVPSLRR